MAASVHDQYVLSTDTTFQNRVQSSLLAACVAISNEGWSIPFHRERATFCAQILTNTVSPNPYVTMFTNSVSTDANVIGDATQNGTVVLTSGNVAAQAALVSDAHIATAIASQFNSFIREPAN